MGNCFSASRRKGTGLASSFWKAAQADQDAGKDRSTLADRQCHGAWFSNGAVDRRQARPTYLGRVPCPIQPALSGRLVASTEILSPDTAASSQTARSEGDSEVASERLAANKKMRAGSTPTSFLSTRAG